MSAALKLWSPPIPKHRIDCPMTSAAALMKAADLSWLSDNEVDWKCSGFLVRCALETTLGLWCRKLQIQERRTKHERLLLEAGAISTSEWREISRLYDRGNAAVHNKPFLQADCENLYVDVKELIEDLK